MNNVTKYNLKTFAISVLGLVLLFCVLAYAMAPDTDGFDISSVNPIEFLKGSVFFLGFGFGFPIWLSVIVVGTVTLLIFTVFWGIARKIMK